MDYGLDDIKMILAPSALIICIVWDISFGVAKDYLNFEIPSWVPSNLFVLSALTIQMLSYVDVERVNVLGPSNAKDMQELVDNQLRMDAARLTMCVFVGCLLPGMAMAGSIGRWSNVAALFLALSFHIATEIYALQNVNDSQVQSEAGPWFLSSGVVLLVGASSLLLLLGVVILYGKFVRDQRPRIAESISEDVENQGEKWKSLRSEVMKSWVAASAWKTKYFMMTSVFSPGAGVIVTICVAVMAAKLGCRSSLLLSRNNKHGGGNLITFYLQCIFILVGWILMLCRWFKAALYCAPSFDIESSTKIVEVIFMPAAIVVSPLSHSLAYTLFQLDDLTIDCFDCYDWREIAFLFVLGIPFLPLWVLIYSIRHFKLSNIIIISLLSIVPLLPLCALTLALFILWFFCVISCCLSVIVFGSQYVQRLCKPYKEVHSVKEYTSLLNEMHISIDDDPRTFWILNKRSYNRINRRIDAAYRKSESCTGLRSIISKHKAAQHLFLGDSTNAQGLLLTQRHMTTISRILRVMHFYNVGIPEDFKDVLAAYRETRDVVKFVDYPENIVVDPLNIFGTLNFQGFKDSIECEERMQIVERKMKERSSTSLEGHPERVKERESEIVKSIDRILYPLMPRTVQIKLDVDRLSMNELKEMLCTLLCHIIVSAVLEAPDVLSKCMKQWAGNCDERKIEGAVDIAGKVSRFLEMMGDAATDVHSAVETRVEGPSEITTA